MTTVNYNPDQRAFDQLRLVTEEFWDFMGLEPVEPHQRCMRLNTMMSYIMIYKKLVEGYDIDALPEYKRLFIQSGIIPSVVFAPQVCVDKKTKLTKPLEQTQTSKILTIIIKELTSFMDDEDRLKETWNGVGLKPTIREPVQPKEIRVFHQLHQVTEEFWNFMGMDPIQEHQRCLHLGTIIRYIAVYCKLTKDETMRLPMLKDVIIEKCDRKTDKPLMTSERVVKLIGITKYLYIQMGSGHIYSLKQMWNHYGLKPTMK